MLQKLHDLYLRYIWESEGEWDTILDYFYGDDILDIAVSVVEDQHPKAGLYKSAVLTQFLMDKLKAQSPEFKKNLLK